MEGSVVEASFSEVQGDSWEAIVPYSCGSINLSIPLVTAIPVDEDEHGMI
jgi:hypothetical protein